MSVGGPVQYHQEDGIARVTLNRPEALNAMNEDLLRQLASLLDRVGGDDAVRALIITGRGEAFSAGADIQFLNQARPIEVREFARLAVSVNHTIETLGKIVVAAINGYALGGRPGTRGGVYAPRGGSACQARTPGGPHRGNRWVRGHYEAP